MMVDVALCHVVPPVPVTTLSLPPSIVEETPPEKMSGGQGLVYIYHDKKLVVKISDSAEKERQILEKCVGHPRIMQVISESCSPTTLVSHYGGADLYTWLTTPEWTLPANAGMQLLEGVAFLHSMSIIHRDIKAENATCDDQGRVQLIDFGFAEDLSWKDKNYLCRNSVGSYLYAPPEIYPKKVVDNYLDPVNTTRNVLIPYDGFAADGWSLGVLLYCIETGKPPFGKATMKDQHYSKFLRLRGPPARRRSMLSKSSIRQSFPWTL